MQEAMNTTFPPDNTNPMAPNATETATRTINITAPYTDVNTGTTGHHHATASTIDPHPAATAHTKATETHTAGHHHHTSKIRETLHDIKENVKETLSRDHPRNGVEHPKRAQDGKTNPME